MYLHREGRKIIIISSVLLVFLGLLLFILKIDLLWKLLLISPFLILYLLILWFFRIPERKNNFNEKFIYAPADGKVVVIEETMEDEYFHDKRIQISIFMSPLNVHQNTYPISGEIIFTRYHKGKYLVAWHPKSSKQNERNTIVVKHPDGTEILIRQIAGAVARRICTYSLLGERVKQGDELGFIRFGSRVDVFVPLTAKITCGINQNALSKITVLAEL